MRMFIVDAFTNQAYKGNPAAVCLLDADRPESWMQNVAAEMNLSETAFLIGRDTEYSLRWFTPEAEVDLCGHATLASAHVLWEQGLCTEDEIYFATKSGELTARLDEEGIHLNFPLELEQRCEPPDQLINGLNIPFTYVGKNRMDYIVEVENEEVLSSMKPDFQLLKTLDCRGIIVTSRSTHAEVDFVSRCFFPAIGVNEDPVTGSAHCCLGPYWAEKLHKTELIALQRSARKGTLKLKIVSDRIIITGQAVTTLIGRLTERE